MRRTHLEEKYMKSMKFSILVFIGSFLQKRLKNKSNFLDFCKPGNKVPESFDLDKKV